MNNKRITFGFVSGVVTGLAGILLAIFCYYHLYLSRTDASLPSVAFQPAFVTLSNVWVTPESPQTFSLKLLNSSRSTITIEKLQFSHPCCTGLIAGSRIFPIQVPAGASVPVVVTVKSLRQERGPAEVKIDALTEIDGQNMIVRAVARIEFAQVLNSTPLLLSFGEIDPSRGKVTRDVSVWCPPDGPVPVVKASVQTEDPSVSAVFTKTESPSTVPDRSIDFGKLSVTIDPSIAPSRLNTTVILRSGSHELRFPVLAFVSDAILKEDKP